MIHDSAPRPATRMRLPIARPLAMAVHLAIAAAVMAGIAATPVAFAQDAASTTHAYAIPPGTLADALDRFAREAAVSVNVPAELTRGKSSRGLQGQHGVEEGLAELLRGHSLQATRNASGGYTVAQAGAVATAADEAALPTIEVVANALGEITEGSGSYASGAIATATRLVLTPRETPQSISVVTRQTMDDFNLTSIDEVMAHTPGVAIVTYDSERTEYYSRGFAIQNFQYDGIPMRRDSSYSAGNTLTDMALYDRIEVLKGATGLLTGSGEPGATINLIRKKPSRDFGGHATIGIGSNDDYRGEVDIGGALNDSGSVRARAVGAYQDTGSNLDRYKRESKVLYGILEADLGPQTLFTIGGDYQDNNPTASTWGGIPLLDSNGNFNDRPRSFNNGANWSHWDQYTRTGFATIEHSFDNGWIAKAQFNHQINGYDANLGAGASGFPNPADGTGVSMWVGQYIGRTISNALDAYASGPFSLAGREHELVVGVGASRRVWRNSGWWNLPDYDFAVHDYYSWDGDVPRPQWGPTPDYTNDETTREEGLYTAVRWNLHDTTKLITGGRFSNYRNKVQDLDASGEFVPYIGLVQDLGKHYSAYASYTSIFSPQSKQDEEGRTLAPVEGNNMELGVKAEYFDGRFNASAAVFRLEQDNFGIESGGLTPSGGIAYRAAKGVETEGFEIEASGRILPGWQIQAGYSHHLSRQQGERVTTLTPSNSFTFYTSYSPQQTLKGLTFGGGARWQDETWGIISAPGNTSIKHTVDGYWVADAMARYRFNDNLSASLNVKNLLDKKYYTIFSWYSTYTWGAPRSVDLSLTYRF